MVVQLKKISTEKKWKTEIVRFGMSAHNWSGPDRTITVLILFPKQIKTQSSSDTIVEIVFFSSILPLEKVVSKLKVSFSVYFVV